MEQPSKPPRTSADAAARAVNTLQRHFPHAFPHSPASKVPLKVGVLKDVLARAASLGLNERDARNGVKLWCGGQRYWSCLVEGNVRVDPTGAITSVVTAVEAECGTSQERTRLARRREQIANKRRASALRENETPEQIRHLYLAGATTFVSGRDIVRYTYDVVRRRYDPRATYRPMM
ncbi:ProQ/FinO family protein [Caballeronia calidae]|uniref:ProQ/FinO family protein n=1 Tax=Caballeronia calidae TaxID=1777139 RepID=UPI0035B56556